jgi:tetratricopeptide (TPR) repeat protein
VIKLYPEGTAAYFNRALAKTELKDYAGAIEDYTTAIKKDPNPGMAYYNRGLLKLKLKDNQGACGDLEKAQSLHYEKAAAAVLQYCK